MLNCVQGGDILVTGLVMHPTGLSECLTKAARAINWGRKDPPSAPHKRRGKGVAIMWMVFVAADIGFLAGGIFSGTLVRGGNAPPASRLWVMLISACLVPCSVLVPQLPTVAMVITVAMIVCYGHTQWLTNMTSLVVDVMPKRILATSFGVIAAGSALGGIFMNKLVAACIDPNPIALPAMLAGSGWADSALIWLNAHRGYDSLFVLMACVHPVALALIWGLRRRGTRSATESPA
jgi:ACS family hexuronate transporter-like MFS transporter